MKKGKLAGACFFYIDRAYKQLRAEHPDWPIARVIEEVKRKHYPFGARPTMFKAWCEALNSYSRMKHATERAGKAQRAAQA